MTDEHLLEGLRTVVTECRELGASPRAAMLEYLERTAPVIESNVREAPPLLRGDHMIVVELPKETFERMVLNDRLYRKLHQRSA